MTDKQITIVLVLSCALFFVLNGEDTGGTSGRWSVDRTSVPDKVHLTLRRTRVLSRSQTSLDIPSDDLKGLSHEQIDSLRSAVRFDIPRDAGRVIFFPRAAGGR